MSAAFTWRRSNDGALMPGSAVTHYFATTALLKVCMQAVTAFKSFHLPACLHHPLAHHAHCTWQEMNRGQPCISFKSRSICVRSSAICIAYAFVSGSNLSSSASLYWLPCKYQEQIEDGVETNGVVSVFCAASSPLLSFYLYSDLQTPASMRASLINVLGGIYTVFNSATTVSRSFIH